LIELEIKSPHVIGEGCDLPVTSNRRCPDVGAFTLTNPDPQSNIAAQSLHTLMNHRRFFQKLILYSESANRICHLRHAYSFPWSQSLFRLRILFSPLLHRITQSPLIDLELARDFADRPASLDNKLNSLSLERC
jgi:hypothetical protein